MKTLSIIVLVLAHLGCDSGITEPQSIDGVWIGRPLNVKLEITQANGSFHSIGSFSNTTDNAEFTGRCSFPSISFYIVAFGYEQIEFTGRLRDDKTIVGKLNGNRFLDYPLTLTKLQ